MFSIFHGRQRGFGVAEDEIFLKLGVLFRKHLKYFKGARLSILMNLALHMNERGWAIVPIRTIHAETDYNSQTIMEATRALNEVVAEIGRRPLYTIQVRSKGGTFLPNWNLMFPTDEEIAALDAFLEGREFVLLHEIETFAGTPMPAAPAPQPTPAPAPVEPPPATPVLQVSFVEAPAKKTRAPRRPKTEDKAASKEKTLVRKLQEAYYEFEPGMAWDVAGKGAARTIAAVKRLGWTDDQTVLRVMQCVRYYDSQWTSRPNLQSIASQINKWVQMGMPKADGDTSAEVASYEAPTESGPVVFMTSVRGGNGARKVRATNQ